MFIDQAASPILRLPPRRAWNNFRRFWKPSANVFMTSKDPTWTLPRQRTATWMSSAGGLLSCLWRFWHFICPRCHFNRQEREKPPISQVLNSPGQFASLRWHFESRYSRARCESAWLSIAFYNSSQTMTIFSEVSGVYLLYEIITAK